MKLIVGLGNPGTEYNKTRHNIGFMILDFINPGVVWKNKFNGLFYKTNIENEEIIYLKPQTYMNLSGESVKEFINYFKIELENILIIHDDLDLEIGKPRLKFESSAGGHNGIKSIINNLKTNKFLRLKIGIGNANIDTKDYVLNKFTKQETELFAEKMPEYKKIVEDFIKNNNKEKLMNKYN